MKFLFLIETFSLPLSFLPNQKHLHCPHVLLQQVLEVHVFNFFPQFLLNYLQSDLCWLSMYTGMHYNFTKIHFLQDHQHILPYHNWWLFISLRYPWPSWSIWKAFHFLAAALCLLGKIPFRASHTPPVPPFQSLFLSNFWILV